MAGLFSTPKTYTPPVETPEEIKKKASLDRQKSDQLIKDAAYWSKLRVGRNTLVNTGIYIPD